MLEFSGAGRKRLRESFIHWVPEVVSHTLSEFRIDGRQGSSNMKAFLTFEPCGVPGQSGNTLLSKEVPKVTREALRIT